MSTGLATLIERFRSGDIDGKDLASMVLSGEITKSDRRKISKSVLKKEKVLSERQRLRMEAKAKKQLPKLSRDDRHRKYVIDRNDEIREKKMQKNMICLGCREEGHILKYCMNIRQNNPEIKKICCFNCGESDHALRNCKKPQVPSYLPFAECFICKQKGHISKDCSQNLNGLYPYGGCCHICLKKDHLVRYCPKKPIENEQEKEVNSKFSKNEIVLNTVDEMLGDDYIDTLKISNTDTDDDDERGEANNNNKFLLEEKKLHKKRKFK